MMHRQIGSSLMGLHLRGVWVVFILQQGFSEAFGATQHRRPEPCAAGQRSWTKPLEVGA
jgi:hypothetical protein